MGLQKIKVKMTSAPLVKNGIPAFFIEGDLVSRYNDADALEKTAIKEKNELRSDLVEYGVTEIYRYNVDDPAKPITTVKLTDATNSELQVQFTSAYAPADCAAAEQIFEALTGDDEAINLYAQEIVVGKWDKKAFLDPEGKFDKRKYDKYRLAIEKVALELREDCPLTTEKLVVPLGNFHERRWREFPVFESQQQITAVLPNTVKLVPGKVSRRFS